MWPAYGHYGLSLADGSASRPVNQLLRTRLRQEGARLPRPNTSATGLTVLANAVALPPWPRAPGRLWIRFRSTATPGAPRRHPAPYLRRPPAGSGQPHRAAVPSRNGPSDACEHRIGERMARVAHSIMTYFQRNPGIKRKSKSTHHHPESPMCIDPLGAHGSRRPITAPHRKPRNLREIWRLLRIVTFSHVQLRVVPPFNRAGRGEDHATALDRTVTRSLGKVRSRDARNSLRPPP